MSVPTEIRMRQSLGLSRMHVSPSRRNHRSRSCTSIIGMIRKDLHTCLFALRTFRRNSLPNRFGERFARADESFPYGRELCHHNRRSH